MDREELVTKWLDIANQDLQVAELSHNNGYWLHAAFLCHQSLEKTIKGYYVATPFRRICNPADPNISIFNALQR